MAIDAINPFLSQNINQYQKQSIGVGFGGQKGVQKVNPFAQPQPTSMQGGADWNGFNAKNWGGHHCGLQEGALGEAGAVNSTLPGGQQTRLGARLNLYN